MSVAFSAPSPARVEHSVSTISSSRLDVARVFAAYSIVWLHSMRFPETVSWSAVGRLAVPFFVILSVMFAVFAGREQPGRPFGEYLRKRFTRLYVPFLGWSAIYFVFKLVKLRLLPDQPNDFHLWTLPYEGTFYHLWFVPFIMAAGAAIFIAARAAQRWKIDDRVTIGVSAVIAAALCFLPIGGLLDRGEYWGLVGAALPSVFVGAALATWWQREPPTAQRIGSQFWLVVAVVSIGVIAWQGRQVGCETLGGLALVLWSYSPRRDHSSTLLGKLATTAMGLYFAHMLFIKVAESALTKLGIGAGPRADVGVFLFASFAATVCVLIAARFQTLRRFVV